jgi:hypothetical protein
VILTDRNGGGPWGLENVSGVNVESTWYALLAGHPVVLGARTSICMVTAAAARSGPRRAFRVVA